MSKLIGQIQKALFVYNMNAHKKEVSDDVKRNHLHRVYVACKEFVSKYEQEHANDHAR